MVAQIESRKYHVTADDIARRKLNLTANLASGLDDLGRITESITAFSKILREFHKNLQDNFQKYIQPQLNYMTNDLNDLRDVSGDSFLTGVGNYSFREISHWWHNGIYSNTDLSEKYKAACSFSKTRSVMAAGKRCHFMHYSGIM